MRVVDLHCDSLYESVTKNIALNDSSLEVVLNSAPESRKLQCYAVWVPDGFSPSDAEKLFYSAAKRLDEECKRLSIELLKPGSGCKKAFSSHNNSAYLTIENGLALGNKLDNVRRFADMGVRMMTLTWNAENAIGGGADTKKGLTGFGKQVVREMERAGMIVDISHASEELFYDVAESTSKPFVASHSNAYSVTSHRRNLKNEQIREIIRRKGLFGLNFHNAFLNDSPDRASVYDILRHAEHFLSLGGDDCLCFGSDFDGGVLPYDIKDSRVYDKIYELFLQHHYKQELVDKIFFENALNFFENFDIQRIL